MVALKAQLLETVRHYATLEKDAQFATFLTYAALDPPETYTAKDFRVALGSLPQQGVEEAAQALVQALEAAGEQREDYWANRIRPFWQDIWPKSLQLASKDIAESLARLSIAAGGQFPAALAAVENWLQPIRAADFVVDSLDRSRLSGRFPEDALRLLDAVIDDQSWAPPMLAECLKAISDAKPALQNDPRFQRLKRHLERRGI
jgi:hypothetical protein